MARPRTYDSNAERQRAYRDRHHVCHAESILPRRLELELARLAGDDVPLFYRLFEAVTFEYLAARRHNDADKGPATA